MISSIRKRFSLFAILLNLIIIAESIYPAFVNAAPGMSTQPEAKGPIGSEASEMVNTFTGDFAYSVPLLDIGGYPVNLNYAAGQNSNQDASWVGLGWSLNPGMVTRGLNGLPDDFKGDIILDTTNFAPHVIVGHNLDFNLGAGASIPIGGPLSINAGLYPHVGFEWFYDTYLGKGYGFNLGTGLSAGLGLSQYINVGVGGSLNADIKHNSMTGFQNTIGYGGNFGVGVFSYGINGNFSAIRSRNSRTGAITTASGSNTTLDYWNYNDLGANGYTLSQKSLPALIPSNQPAMYYKSSTQGFGLQLGVAMPLASSSLGVKHTKYTESNYLKSFVNAYPSIGMLYQGTTIPGVGSRQKRMSGLNDYYKLHQYNRFSVNTEYLPQISNTEDAFNASAVGLSEPFKIQRSNVGMHYEPYTVSNTSGTDFMGKETVVKLVVPMWGWETIKRYKYVSNVRKEWSNTLSNKLDYSGKSDNHLPIAVFKSQKDLGFANDQYINAIGDEQLLSPTLAKVENSNPSYFDVTDFSNSPVTTGIKDEASIRRKAIMNYLTAEEASRISRNKLIEFFEIEEDGDFTLVKESRINNFRRRHHISEIQCGNVSGTSYVFGIPVYNRIQLEKTFNVTTNATSTANIEALDNTNLMTYTSTDDAVYNTNSVDHFFSSKSIPPYATGYLLTEVHSSNYCDVTQDGCTDDDLGDYVRFDYVRTHSNYRWRTPSSEEGITNKGYYLRGLRSDGIYQPDKQDDRVTYVYGERENYYIHKIESKTELAIFYISQREDGKQVADINGNKDNDLPGLYKLDSICLFSKYALAENPATLPIKTVHFEYDYSLCNKGQGNSSIQGKLTLKAVYFTSGTNRIGQFNKYQFNYYLSYGNSQYFQCNLNNVDRWGNYRSPNGLANSYPFNQATTDFTYTYQDDITNEFAKAWNLSDIKLPSGGTIHVEYESDAYSNVQNQTAMQMYKIFGFMRVPPTTNTIYPYVTNDSRYDLSALYDYKNEGIIVANRKQKDWIILELPDNSDETYNNIVESFKDSILYFNLLVKVAPNSYGSNCLMVSSPATDGGGTCPLYERVSGYARISGNKEIKRIYNGNFSTATSLPNNFPVVDGLYGEFNENYFSATGYSNKVAIKVDKMGFNDETPTAPESHDYSPFSYSSWQFARVAYPSIIYHWDGDNFSWDMNSAVRGLFAMMEFRQYCRHVDLEHSWARLSCAKGYKLGGGYRVKSLTFSDNWSDMTDAGSGTAEQAVSYTQVYDYTTTEGLCSGVASYEPFLGSEENPFKRPVSNVPNYKWNYYQEADGAPDEYAPLIGPLCEQFFPSPMVGYSSVKVKTLPANVNLDASNAIPAGTADIGFTQYEYLTLKDQPTIVTQTPLSNKNLRVKDGSSDFISELNNATNIVSNYFHGAQSYNVISTDIHGKPKSIKYISSTGDVVKAVKFHYKDPFAKNLEDRAVLVLCEDGVVRKKEFGKEIELAGESYESVEKVQTAEIKKSRMFFVFIPHIKFKAVNTTVYNNLRYFTSTKLINKSNVLDNIELNDGNVTNIISNQLYDAQTGNVICTSTSTVYNNPTYNFNLPAYTAYPNMGPAYQNEAHEGQLTISEGSAIISDLSLTSGDELYLVNNDNNGIYYKAWIKDAIISSGNITLTLIDQFGVFIPNGKFNYKVVNSGRKNLLNSSISAITTLQNPIVVNSALSIDNTNKIVSANASRYSDQGSFYEQGVGKKITELSFSSASYADLIADLNALLAYDYTATPSEVVYTGHVSYTNTNGSSLQYTSGLDGFVGKEIHIEGNSNFLGRINKHCFISLVSVDGSDINFSNVTGFSNTLGSPVSLFGLDKNELYVVASISGGGTKLVQVNSDCFTLNSNLQTCGTRDECGYSRETKLNPFLTGLKNIWKALDAYTFNTTKHYAPTATLATDGYFNNYNAFWESSSGNLMNEAVSHNHWLKLSEVALYHPNGGVIETKNALGNSSNILRGYGGNWVTAETQNAKFEETYFDGFEDYNFEENINCAACIPRRHMLVYKSNPADEEIPVNSSISHTGHYSIMLSNVLHFNAVENEQSSSSNAVGHEYYYFSPDILKHYAPLAGKHILTFWINRSNNADYSSAQVIIGSTTYSLPASIKEEVEGWKRVEIPFEITTGTTNLMIQLVNTSENAYYIDDFRLQPAKSEMVSYVYDIFKNRLMATLDSRNFATFYEYDVQGNLVRVKQETTKGIYTLNENRVNLVRQ